MHKSCFMILSCFCVFMANAFAQDAHENGILMLESTFDDFDPGPMNPAGITVIGVFDDIPDNDTPVLEIELPGGTENPWNELLAINWDTPENSEEITWRFQFRIRVINTPYDAQVRLQINQEPWNGFNLSRTIPGGKEEQWLFFDFLGSPFANFNFNVLNFSLRFGAQQPQLMWLDDIRVYQSNALQISSFESSLDARFALGHNTAVELIAEDTAPEGLQVLLAAVTDSGNALEDAWVNPARIINNVRHEGAMRITAEVQSSQPGVEIRAGIANSNDLEDQLVFAQETFTLSEPDTWTTVSFLVQPLPFFGARLLFPFFQFGGQGNVEFKIDRLTVLKTDEIVDVPAAVSEWSVY